MPAIGPAPAPALFEDAQPVPSPVEVRGQLQRILASKPFAKSEQLRSMLRYLVETTLEFADPPLKEILLGRELFGRGPDFDPRVDPIVRVEARRLRARLNVYYGQEGAGDKLIIKLEPGSYAPQFEWWENAADHCAPASGPAANTASEDDPCSALCLAAKAELGKGATEHGLKALQLLQQAASLYPDRAEPHAGLSLLLFFAGMHLMEGRTGLFRQAREKALLALQLDRQAATAHAVLGVTSVVLDYDFAAANTSLLRALRREPENQIFRNLRTAFWLMPLGLLSSVEDELGRDPWPPSAPGYMGRQLVLSQSAYLRRRPQEAIHLLEAVLAINPRFLPAQSLLALALASCGRHRQLEEISAQDSLVPYPILRLWIKGSLALTQGDCEGARTAAAEMEIHTRPEITEPVLVANLWARLGETARACTWLDRAFESRSLMLLNAKADPLFDPLRQLPEFQNLLVRMNIAEAATF